MVTASPVSPSSVKTTLSASSVSWEDALREYVFHLSATHAVPTARFNRTQITQLMRWADAQVIPFEEFGARHMNRYIVYRREQGRARLTLRHDGVCAKKFFAWCVRAGFLDRSPLAEYEVHNAPKPPRHMPSEEEVANLFEALRGYWNPEKRPAARYMPAPVRLFLRDRNLAIVAGLVDVGCRIGEIVSLKVDDYDPKTRQVTFRETKGKESRSVPVSAEWAETMDVWLRLRRRVMQNAAPGEDEGWLFVSDTGGKVDPMNLLHTLHRVTDWAEMPRLIFHDFRRFSINKHVLVNPFLTQHMVGHKDPKTTQGYTRLSVEDVRKMQTEVDLLGAVMSNKRAAPMKRRRLL